MIRDVSKDYDEISVPVASWWSESGDDGPKPYEHASWTYTVVEVEEEDTCSSDLPDPNCVEEAQWWWEIGDDGPKPYAMAAWTVTTSVIAETEEDQADDSIAYEAFSRSGDWWEDLGDDGPKPYEAASWTFTVVVISDVEEFIRISRAALTTFDETTFDRTSLGIILDSGYFGQVAADTYDGIYFLEDEREILVKRTISRLMVYDSRANSPGNIGSFLQPLGTLASDPVEAVEELLTNPDDNQIALFRSAPIGLDPLAEPVGTDPDATGLLTETFVGLLGLDPINTTAEIAIDPSGDVLELVRYSNVGDDVPPGALLGSVSYETFDGVLTVTDWEHLNWEDDRPVLMGVKTLLSQIPDGVTEVRVLDPPHAFWTSLGFAPEYKGDPYLHIHL